MVTTQFTQWNFQTFLWPCQETFPCCFRRGKYTYIVLCNLVCSSSPLHWLLSITTYLWLTNVFHVTNLLPDCTKSQSNDHAQAWNQGTTFLVQHGRHVTFSFIKKTAQFFPNTPTFPDFPVQWEPCGTGVENITCLTVLRFASTV